MSLRIRNTLSPTPSPWSELLGFLAGVGLVVCWLAVLASVCRASTELRPNEARAAVARVVAPCIAHCNGLGAKWALMDDGYMGGCKCIWAVPQGDK